MPIHKDENPFEPGPAYPLKEVCEKLQQHNLHPAMVDRGYTNTGWHFMGLMGRDDETSYVAFFECGTGSVLYVAIDGRTAMFRRYDSLAEAMDAQSDLRQSMALVEAYKRKLVELHRQWAEQEANDVSE